MEGTGEGAIEFVNTYSYECMACSGVLCVNQREAEFSWLPQMA